MHWTGSLTALFPDPEHAQAPAMGRPQVLRGHSANSPSLSLPQANLRRCDVAEMGASQRPGTLRPTLRSHHPGFEPGQLFKKEKGLRRAPFRYQQRSGTVSATSGCPVSGFKVHAHERHPKTQAPSPALRIAAIQAGRAAVHQDQGLGAALVAQGRGRRERGAFAGHGDVFAARLDDRGCGGRGYVRVFF